MIRKCLFIICLNCIYCYQVNAFVDSSILSKRQILNYTYNTEKPPLDHKQTLEDDLESIINKVNIERVKERVYFLKRLARLKSWSYLKFETFLSQGDSHSSLAEIKHRLYLLG